MKRFSYFTFLSAVALAVSCEVSEPIRPHDGLIPFNGVGEAAPEWSEFIFTSDGEESSKTVHTNSTIYWSSGDAIRMGYTVNGYWQGTSGNASQSNPAKLYASNSLSEGGATASFTVPGQFTGSANGEYKFYTVYPASASAEDCTSAPSTVVTIPTEQTPAATSFDPAADLMIGHSARTYSSRPSEAIPLQWERKVAHGEITLKNFSGITGFSTDETIQSITLTAQSSAALTGSYSANLTTGVLTSSAASNSVTVSGTNLSWGADGTVTFWISILPVSITSLDVTLVTDKATYTKSFSGFTRVFAVNTRNQLGIKMTGATRTGNVQYYELVTSSLTDWSGQYVLGYDNGSVKKMLTGISNTSTKYGIATDVAITDDTITYEDGHPYEITIAKSGSYYTIALGGQYLGWSSGNSLIFVSSPSNNNNGLWAFSYDSNGDVLTITNVSTINYIEPRLLQYNSGSPRFACYTSAQQAPSLYKLTSSGGDTPPDPQPEATATVTTGAASNIAQTSATLNGSFSGATGTISEVGFYWGTTDNPATAVDATGTTSPFNYPLSGLTAGTTYYYQAYVKEYNAATASFEERKGLVQSFTTEAATTTQYYEKVTSALSDWSGEYLIVYESGSLAFNGGKTSSLHSSNTIGVSINNNRIEANTTTNAAKFTIAKSGNYYTIKSESGYYIGNTQNKTYLEYNQSTAFTNSIAYNSGSIEIKGSDDTTYLRYNLSVGGTTNRFCYIPSGSLSGSAVIQLYKLTNGSGSTTPTATATVTTGAASNVSNTTATLSGSYAGATGTISATGFYWGTTSNPTTRVTTGSTSASFSKSLSGLTAGTTYYYKAFVVEYNESTSSTEERYGEIKSFTTTGGSQVTYQYLSDYGMPDISGLGVSLRTSGTNSDRDDKWYSYNTNNNKRQIAVHTYSTGAPNNSETCNYVVLYDETKYAPVWTAHTMNSTYWPDNNAGRNDSWTNDPAISLTQQTGLDNASTVGYSRGHLVASNYRQTTDEQNKQTFYYSNQAPQWQNSFNSGVWSSLETRVVEMTPSGTTMLYVITGVLYEGTITTLRSGSLNVPIPSHFYKCIMRCTFSGGTISGAQGIAFVYTNEAHSGNYYNSAFVTTIDAIEARAGFDFFAAVPSTYQNSAESNSSHKWFTGQN